MSPASPFDAHTIALQSSYDRVAAEYAERFFHELDYKPFDRALLDYLTSQVHGLGPVADIGCGPGQIARYLADRGIPVLGIDLAPEMVTLARRRAIDKLRKKQAYARAEERLQREIEQQPDAWVHNSTEEEILDGDRRILMRRVIEMLPPPQQQAIELAFFRGMSQREIAANTNTPLGTVKTRLELGLKKIYDGLKELRDEL